MVDSAAGLTTEEARELEAEEFADELGAAAAASSASRDPNLEDVLSESIEPEGDAGSGTIPKVTASEKSPIAPAQTDNKFAKHGLPIQRLTGDLADAWERWSNALSSSPSSPSFCSASFSPSQARIRLALYLLPIIIVMLVFSSEFLVNALSFILGVAFFGDPLLEMGWKLMDRFAGPTWTEELEVRK